MKQDVILMHVCVSCRLAQLMLHSHLLGRSKTTFSHNKHLYMCSPSAVHLLMCTALFPRGAVVK